MTPYFEQDGVTRPAFRYYGGKWTLAEWIISVFPKHRHYVEPCGGAASVLLQKPLSEIETYNDLNGDLVRFFRVLRSRTEELCHAIEWTPWAREEFELSKQPAADDVEAARRWWVFHMMSVNAAPGHMREGGWKSFRRDGHESRNTHDNRCREQMIQNLFAVAKRMRQTQIESRPMLDLLTELDGPETLFYIDPPYVSETRSHGTGMYGVEWVDEDHRTFVDAVMRLQGYCVISGYSCPMYETLERNKWERIDKHAVNNSGNTRTESLWINERTRRHRANRLF